MLRGDWEDVAEATLRETLRPTVIADGTRLGEPHRRDLSRRLTEEFSKYFKKRTAEMPPARGRVEECEVTDCLMPAP